MQLFDKHVQTIQRKFFVLAARRLYNATLVINSRGRSTRAIQQIGIRNTEELTQCAYK
jgi:hypothetical protein